MFQNRCEGSPFFVASPPAFVIKYKIPPIAIVQICIPLLTLSFHQLPLSNSSALFNYPTLPPQQPPKTKNKKVMCFFDTFQHTRRPLQHLFTAGFAQSPLAHSIQLCGEESSRFTFNFLPPRCFLPAAAQRWRRGRRRFVLPQTHLKSEQNSLPVVLH